MRCFLDTEYTDIDHPVLISVALVADDGREFYAEASDGWTPRDCSAFVIQNVLPHLHGKPDVAMSRTAIRDALPRWLSSLGAPATIIYDLRADWRMLGSLFDDLPDQAGVHGRRIRWGDPLIEEQFKLWTDTWFKAHGPRHNALVDARCFREGILAIEERFRRRVAD